jgi:hypothetical protein
MGLNYMSKVLVDTTSRDTIPLTLLTKYDFAELKYFKYKNSRSLNRTNYRK